MVVLVVVAVVCFIAGIIAVTRWLPDLAQGPVAAANPSPPTEGGNGAGKSGQCTGKAADRPASCQSP
jgi:hypothetical protein